MNRLKFAALLLPCVCLLMGCSRPAAAGQPQLHQDTPPHGGTPVPLGDNYNLELVRDPAEGTLAGYVLDDEMEEFVHSSSPSIVLVIRTGGEDRTIELMPVANSATGETVGDTSQFEGRADWLKTTGGFTGVLQRVTVRGTEFSNVQFSFPAHSP